MKKLNWEEYLVPLNWLFNYHSVITLLLIEVEVEHIEVEELLFPNSNSFIFLQDPILEVTPLPNVFRLDSMAILVFSCCEIYYKGEVF